MLNFYPIKFKFQLKDKIWGGNKLSSTLNKQSESISVGESWELSGLKDNESVVRNGDFKGKNLSQLISKFKGKLVGEEVYALYQNEFPLLVKFIDASADLSIQVHPNDELAQKRGHNRGKSEMWYICQADEGSSVISGFNKDLSQEEYLKLVATDSLGDVLNRESAQKGDVFDVPAGRIHTIGKGLLLAEIQQSSDVTYRVSDFGRKDKDGHLRELHTEESVAALDFTCYPNYRISYEQIQNQPVNLVSNKYFVVNKLSVEEQLKLNYRALHSFVILVCTEGEASVTAGGVTESVSMGEVVLLPACLDEVVIDCSISADFLEVYIGKK
jgi:mannose-6-phosphate isomerase